MVTPTGVATASLLDLEFADPPAEPLPKPTVTTPPPSVDQPTVELHPIGPTALLPVCAGEQLAHGSTDRALRFYRDRVLDHLNQEMIEFVGRMETAFVSTADADGESASHFRGGPPGFLHVLDPKRIAYPEYRGNGVLGDIIENPHVALLMIDLGRELVGLHVNGGASIVDDRELRALHPKLPVVEERGATPDRWVVVHVMETFVRCRKHAPRLRPVARQATGRY